MIDSEQVYQLLNQIPQGKVTTYKEIAQKLNTKAYQAIGQIIGANPNAPQVPCHRVVKSDGSISGYAFGVSKKIALLKAEGIEVKQEKIVNFEKKIYKFS